MSSGILVLQIQIWPPHWPPQTAAARNAPVRSKSAEDIHTYTYTHDTLPRVQLGLKNADRVALTQVIGLVSDLRNVTVLYCHRDWQATVIGFNWVTTKPMLITA